jgi:membrane fusion protein, multidrug efflux system
MDATMPSDTDQIPQVADASAVAAPPPHVRQPMTTGRRLLVGIAVLLIAFALWETLTSYVAYTGDAYVRSALVAISPQVTGQISELHIVDNQPVHKGDLLAKIDPRPFQLAMNAAHETLEAAVATAKAGADSVAAAQDDLQAAEAGLTHAQETQRRSVTLSHEGVTSGESFDSTTAALAAANAKVEASRSVLERAQSVVAAESAQVSRARAEQDLAEWRLSQTSLLAPDDGTVSNLTLRVGDTAYANTPLIGIVAADGWRIIANFKQSYLVSFHTGDTAWVLLDTHPWHLYRARIRGIGRGISRQQGGTALLPYVSPTTDWIRLEHRFPVTLELENPPADLVLFMGADARCIVFP